ncbi:Cys-tRNA(Pro)/Cys-tRNA(Cys) deacylase ybaK [Sarcina ventriculi]|uniref:Cys-tRNA(Pro)/Cys-tRNA(Cys) deacylase n=2 Tax=Sarcina ventriculi TaxID=1267 RepID=A0ABM9UPD1_SARVE|nr:Cys-tRNA(Pro)/Cys-tRNA(Cys) deacylase ybaK [Sarcina ventriculi]SPZ49174.1 Cys-tRNA(Pro)/Cys-tRNA(Cys) deacylase ybaK [Sarcina ventriculi]
MKMGNVKTNAMRILDSKKIEYIVSTYDNKDGKIDGVSVAQKINKNPKEVFKTLVTQGSDRELFVFVIPVESELDLKKAAKVAKEKNVEMIPVKDINKHTGYIRGGCSPIGMKKMYKTFIDISAKDLDIIVVSAGKIGVQVQLKPDDLIKVTSGEFADISR